MCSPISTISIFSGCIFGTTLLVDLAKLLTLCRGLTKWSKISESITGQRSVDFEHLDAKIARRLKKIINGDFKRRVFMEAQHEKRFSLLSADYLDDFQVPQVLRH